MRETGALEVEVRPAVRNCRPDPTGGPNVVCALRAKRDGRDRGIRKYVRFGGLPSRLAAAGRCGSWELTRARRPASGKPRLLARTGGCRTGKVKVCGVESVYRPTSPFKCNP